MEGYNMEASVLLVEDDHDFASSLELALGLIDIEVVRAGSTEQALELFDSGRNSFKLVFCDMKLPGADGISCLEQLFFRNKAIVGVMMTGFRDEALFDRARSVGVAEILLKPFRMADFMDLTRKYLAD
jgi:DNA-binding NtrC family response regulator